MYRHLYSLLWLGLIPFLILKLLLRSRKNPAYRQRILERFACHHYPKKTNEKRVLFHLVSVGETLAAIDLIKTFMQQNRNVQVVISSTTPTGSDRVKAAFSDTVIHCYLPFDLAFAQKRFLTALKPDLVVLMETELWPNTLHYCHQLKVKTVLMNARLSARSLKGYQKLTTLSANMMQQISAVSAQNQTDANRFIKLGLAADKLTVSGSLKFDIAVQPAWLAQAAQFKATWQTQNRLIWLAASTHKGEDEIILAAHQKIVADIPNALLVIVPRHPERFEQVYQMAHKCFATIKRSQPLQAISRDCKVVIGDSMGEMMAYYQLADIALVGGSLIEHGGHNPLEPAALQKPILSGPHVFNFEHIFEQLTAKQAVLMVDNSDEIGEQVMSLFNDAEKRQRLGTAAHQLLTTLGGATHKTLSLLNQQLK